MTDLDLYLTDEAVEKAARTEWEYEWPDRSWERVPDDIRDFYMSVARASLAAVLPDIIQQAKVEALREAAQKYMGGGWAELSPAVHASLAARGPYRCCPHCADDLVHDVEKDDHTVPCQLCQNDEINRAVVKVLRDAAKAFGENQMIREGDVKEWLEVRADQIDNDKEEEACSRHK